LSEYTKITIPLFLRNRLSTIRSRENRALWEILNDAISFYEAQKRSPRIKQKLPPLEKLSWYITKLCFGVSYFLSNPSEENFEQTLKMIESTQNRLKIDMSGLKDTIVFYKNLKSKGRDKRVAVMKVVKDMVARMIERTLSAEEIANE
jgi:hypothetical protein